MFGEQLARGVGSWSPAADGGEVPGTLLVPLPVPLPGGGASAEPCWDPQELQAPLASSLIPLAKAPAPKVRDASAVLERPMLFPSS